MAPPLPEIRRLGAADAAAFRSLRLQALRAHPAAFTSSAEEDERLGVEAAAQRLAAPLQSFWGAFEGDVLLGMAGLERRARAKERHKATVVAMYVVPPAAGRGVGRALLQAVVACARAEGLQLLALTVTEGNAAALRLYQAAGFRAWGTEPCAVVVAGRPHAKVHMALQLAEGAA